MQESGEYPGPSPDDYANVLALNTAFIKATIDMKGPQRGRLAAAPFLLFSLREREPEWWDDALADRRQGELMAAAELSSPELCRLQTAALSFVWQLGRRNPYAARIISGATITWCEKITALPLIIVLDRIGARGDLMQSRLESQAGINKRLISDGTSSSQTVRRSSHLAILQTLLTRSGLDNYTRLPAAACKMPRTMRVRDK
ncbi:MAG: hypothetical protein HQ492_12585 [Woeseiaceae bacterium]|nr:hypothetical protein [Woeseiaceae bacterium]